MTHCSARILLLAAAVGFPQAKPEELCSVEGKVLNALTEDALGKTTLSLTRPDVPSISATPFGTVSDAAGRFAMDRIEPGQYRLIPYGTVSGRVTDEGGEIVAPVAVQLMRYRYVNGKKELASAGSANTDDLGEYRASGLLPGKYILAATYRAPWASIVDRSAKPRAEEGYAMTYYPGVTDPASAMQIEVGAGEQVRGIDLALRKARAATIKGRVVNAAMPGARPNLMMYPAAGPFNNWSLRSVPLDSKSEFEVRGVVPGAYWLMASVQLSGKNYSNRSKPQAGENR